MNPTDARASTSRLWSPWAVWARCARRGRWASVFSRGLGRLLVALVLVGLPSSSIDAQEPPDSVRADTLRAPSPAIPGNPADSLAVLPDSLNPQVQPGAEGQEAPLEAEADTTAPRPRSIRPLGREGPTGWASATWEWGRADLSWNGAMTLGQLLDQIPGAILLRGGDFGTPVAASAFGYGAGRVRVYWDGYEMIPVSGGAVDLSRIGLAGLERVRVRRGLTGMRVELFSLDMEDPRPYSYVEVGTGDLDTNFFRGTFTHPNALGGPLSLALDRIDTEGTARREPGSVAGSWLRYALVKEGRNGVELELRSQTADREDRYAPGKLTRSDVVVRGRYGLGARTVGELFAGRSGQSDKSTTRGDTIQEASRGQLGARLAWESPGAWVRLGHRLQGGDGSPSSISELSVGGEREGMGAVEGSWYREGWEDADGTSGTELRIWSAPLRGVSVFGEWASGTRGVPFVIPPPPPAPADTVDGGEGEPTEPPADTIPEVADPVVRYTDRSGLRLGGQIQWRSMTFGGAYLKVEADSLAPLGLPTDRDGLTLPGGTRTGYEVFGRLPLLRGMWIEGSFQSWDSQPGWRYMPKLIYDANISYRGLFLPTGNFELLVTVGVKGRDPMEVPFADPDAANPDAGEADPEGPSEPEGKIPGSTLQIVPFGQNWYLNFQMRIVSLKIFITFENGNNRPNADFPGVVLPGPRAMYGIRWDLWN